MGKEIVFVDEETLMWEELVEVLREISESEGVDG